MSTAPLYEPTPCWNVTVTGAASQLPVEWLQTSPPVQLSTYWHPVGEMQESVVHAMLSLQFTDGPERHAPPPQASGAVQALLSVHETVLFVHLHPTPAVQTSSVQIWLSSHKAWFGVKTQESVDSLQESAVQAARSSQMWVTCSHWPVPSLQLSSVQNRRSSHSGSDAHGMGGEKRTVSLGRLARVPTSEESKASESAVPERRTQPKFVAGSADHACKLGVTVIGRDPVGMSLTATSAAATASKSSAWTPAAAFHGDAPKVFHVSAPFQACFTRLNRR